jgi:hypothetical protein
MNKQKIRQELKLEKSIWGWLYNVGLRRSGRIRERSNNSSSDDSSNSDSDNDKKSNNVDGDGFKSYDLVVPSAKENKFSEDDIKLAFS